MQRRDYGVGKSLGGPLTKRVKESRVLLVGAGGIGCELLKNLVCTGFGSGWQGAQTSPTEAPPKKAEIVVVDLDTIDLSNLNRQFLFRKQHIKKAKAFVAKETASQFNPSVHIDAHFRSIYDSLYTVDFFQGFDVVFNALDNLAARRHVNRMCLAADVPLIESGTTGFNGQVQAIRKGVTECYDCNEKPVQKSFPICTVRSTPSQPIHCIVWAKSYLLPELFGASEEEDSGMEVTAGDDAEEVAKLKQEAEALKRIRSDFMGTPDFAERVFNKVFCDDIERLRSMQEMWVSRPPPTALVWAKTNIDKDPAKSGEMLATQDQGVWNLMDNLKVFSYAISALTKRMQEGGETAIEFDKDDKDTLDFVTATANIRSHIFGIPKQSEWDVKQMAGNIIPAIATSNALTASLCVMEAFKIIRDPKDDLRRSSSVSSSGAEPLLGGSKFVFLKSKDTAFMISSTALSPPKPHCPVCSPVYAKLYIPANPAEDKTLQALVDLLKARVGYEDFSITTDLGVIYDPDLEDNLEKPLSELGIDGRNIGFITVSDDGDEEVKVDLVLSAGISSKFDSTELSLEPETIVLPPKPAKPVVESEPDVKKTQEDVNADLVTQMSAAGYGSSSSKRKREDEDDIVGGKKKAKAEDAVVIEDDSVVVLD